jgi:hypothetical protein
MFSADKSFEDNLMAFRAKCDELDAECAKILFGHIDILREHGADRAARAIFNGKVSVAIQALADPEPTT